jgi:hypothetical protein
VSVLDNLVKGAAGKCEGFNLAFGLDERTEPVMRSAATSRSSARRRAAADAGLDAVHGDRGALRRPRTARHRSRRRDEIDAETARAAASQAVRRRPARITDQRARSTPVVAVLAGTVNTRLVSGWVARRPRRRPDRRRRARRPVDDRAAAPTAGRPPGRSRPRRLARVGSAPQR